MIRKFTKIKCIYYNDNSYIPAKFDCPDLSIDDVLLKLTTNTADNYEKIASTLVDYAFALYCHNVDLSDFATNPFKYRRENWKLLDFEEETPKAKDPTKTTKSSKND